MLAFAHLFYVSFQVNVPFKKEFDTWLEKPYLLEIRSPIAGSNGSIFFAVAMMIIYNDM